MTDGRTPVAEGKSGPRTERPGDVRMPLSAGKRCLRRPVPRPTQDPQHGQTQLKRQVVCVVEASVQGSPWVHRHGHDGVGLRQEVRACVTNE